MSNTVIIIEDPLAQDTWDKSEGVGDVREFLTTKFDTFPETARIYHEQVAEENDVTPGNEDDIERLGKLGGTFYIVVYAGAPAAYAAVVIVGAIIAAAVIVSNLSTPEIPTTTERNVRAESPNNALSDRQNTARPNGRIPDIFGNVRSTPDLIQVPYKVYENNLEVEYAYMCVGKGKYAVTDIRDGETDASEIEGTKVNVYDPDTSPNSGSPVFTIGGLINEDLFEAKKSNAVNGQTLKVDSKFVGNNNTSVVSTYITSETVNWNDYFEGGDTIIVTNMSFNMISHLAPWVTATPYVVGDIINNNGLAYECVVNHTSTVFGTDFGNGYWVNISTTVDLNGTYDITSIQYGSVGGATQYYMVLDNPSSVNSDWDKVAQFVSYPTLSPTIVNFDIEERWIGPFTMQSENLKYVYINVVAPNGLYIDDTTTGTLIALDITYQVGLTPVNSSGTALGPEVIIEDTIEGSSTSKGFIGYTTKCDPGATFFSVYDGFVKIRVRRKTGEFTGNVPIADEIKWKDCYAMGEVTESDFGDVTTVHSVTVGTEGALEVKNRKLNMLVTRALPIRISGDNFTTSLSPTTSADEIISFICKDPRIGNRSNDEIDFDSIYDTIDEVQNYFGTPIAGYFSYTFDSDNLSFEETLSSIANAVYCTAYRQGSQIKLKFEKETADSVLLFNHRNKIPGSETRSVRFGNFNEFDGVELEYADPETDLIETYYIPTDKSAINPKKIETIGLRYRIQAYFHAWRAWNKIKYQNMTAEFEATQEAALAVVTDRILVADNTRPDIQDGEVLSQDGLVLTLSQDVDLTTYASYTIWLQHTDGTTESIAITAGTEDNEVVLGQAPKQALALSEELFARATYFIVGNTERTALAFLVSEKQPQSNFTSMISAINYDARYYQNDDDYKDGDININGDPI